MKLIPNIILCFIFVIIFSKMLEIIGGLSPIGSYFGIKKLINETPRVRVSRFYSPYCEVSEIPLYLEQTETTKVIWSYWDSEEVPKSVEFALNTWKLFQPNFIICLLSKNTVSEFIKDDFLYSAKSKQEEADILRILLLEKYGGYWLDSTIFLCKPIEDLWEPKNYDIGGYWIPKFTSDLDHKVFENWFIVAPRNSELIKKWKEEFFYALSHPSRKEYIDKIGVDLQYISCREYLMMHCCFLKVIQGNHNYTIKSFSTSDDKEGPFYYLDLYDFNSTEAVLGLITKNNPKINQRILKLRGCERSVFDSMIHLMSPDSKLGKLNEILRKNSISQI